MSTTNSHFRKLNVAEWKLDSKSVAFFFSLRRKVISFWFCDASSNNSNLFLQIEEIPKFLSCVYFLKVFVIIWHTSTWVLLEIKICGING